MTGIDRSLVLRNVAVLCAFVVAGLLLEYIFLAVVTGGAMVGYLLSFPLERRVADHDGWYTSLLEERTRKARTRRATVVMAGGGVLSFAWAFVLGPEPTSPRGVWAPLFLTFVGFGLFRPGLLGPDPASA